MNQVILIGNLGADPEVRVLESGVKLANMRLATNEQYFDKKGNMHTHTEWHSVVCWGGVADYAHKNLRKGAYCRVEGKIRSKVAQTTKGNGDREERIVEILAGGVQLLGDTKSDYKKVPNHQTLNPPQCQTNQQAPEDVDGLPF